MELEFILYVLIEGSTYRRNVIKVVVDIVGGLPAMDGQRTKGRKNILKIIQIECKG